MTDPANLKPLARLPPLPTEVFADPGRHDWYFRDKKPDSVARYVRDDMSSPLGAVAMREAAIAEVDCGGCYGKCVDPANCRLDDVAAIRAIPLPTHAALLDAALALPEVAAMWAAAKDMYDYGTCLADRKYHLALSNALTALEARHE